MIPTSSFTERTRQFCIQSGVAAIIISIISIIHNCMAITEFHWIFLLLGLPNLSVLITGILMTSLNRWIIIMLAVSLVLFILYYIAIIALMKARLIILSPSTFVLFAYTLAIFLYGIVTDLHAKLKENHRAAKAEAEYWSGKI